MPSLSGHVVQVSSKNTLPDTKGLSIEKNALTYLGIETGRVRTAKHFVIHKIIPPENLHHFAQTCLADPLTCDVEINPDSQRLIGYSRSQLLIRKRFGVTDDEGLSAQRSLADYLNQDIPLAPQCIFTEELYYFENKLNAEDLLQIGRRFLGNPLIHQFSTDVPAQILSTGRSILDDSKKAPLFQTFNLDGTEQDLLAISNSRLLALNLQEMQAIRAYYHNLRVQGKRKEPGLPLNPTDCELEIFGQTWSEHCKHKEFNAYITFNDIKANRQIGINSLFKTYIRNATEEVEHWLTRNNQTWLIKVFSDNAGVVRVSHDLLLTWKVETHNSPSALDPYGGALTGILGVNRDAFGTGMGGGKPLFNTNVLCFGPPDYAEPLLPGQLHPQQILHGVVKGIEDGGNKSGIPTVNGSILFDKRFSGKPLVFCGTASLLPLKFAGKESWHKKFKPGDYIVMAGGRVGKDGIHGATFSSQELDENSPLSAVQIGSPLTQKCLCDFLDVACQKDLVEASTDNGAGGLSSSIGELASITNGAEVWLERVPLKYPGLEPWEIFLSEAQERMTIACTPEKWDELSKLAMQMDVELSHVGKFTDTGFLHVNFGDQTIAWLELDFLHNGVPHKQLEAEWENPKAEPCTLRSNFNFSDLILKILASDNACSRESVVRLYDHEVQGKSILKPYGGPRGKASEDAAVLRLTFDDFQGIAIANGICPQFGDSDPFAMSASSFDEAIRSIISVGGRLPQVTDDPLDYNFWSANDNFCVPDSVFHVQNNPDGKEKLGKLVKMCEALFCVSTYFKIPMTSGKDSMKNDFVVGTTKISVPPTVLYSIVAKIHDVRKVVSSEFKAAGDLIYLVGETYEELAVSELAKLLQLSGGSVPQLRFAKAQALYLLLMQAHAEELLASSHDLSGGGLAVALSESAFGGGFGAFVDLSSFDIPPEVALFSESNSRFLVSIRPEHKNRFEELMKARATFLGTTTLAEQLVVFSGSKPLIDLPLSWLCRAWQRDLV